MARVGEQPIYAAEVAAQSQRFHIAPAAALEQLIRFALLAERARQRSAAIDATGPAQREARRLLVERLLEQEFEPTIRREQLPEAELRQAYLKLEHKYVHPRLVEVALLSVYTGPLMKPEPRARAVETARALYEHVTRQTPPLRTPADFEALAKDPVWEARKVKFWRFVQGPTRRNGPFGEKVGGPIQKLKRPGELSGLIEDDSGYHIAQYISETPPQDTPFEAAREELASGYYPYWRRQRFSDWSKALGAAHAIEVYPDRLVAAPAP